MARNDVISKLYKKTGSALDFNFDSLMAPPLYSLIPYQDLERMYKLITSVKYASKTLYKEQEIKKIMEYYGWKRYASGTHRLVYRHLEIPTIIAKISLNKTSLGDNIREMQNQHFLKPFVTKVFDVDPTGMIGIFERVEPFQSKDEFISVAGDIFDLINTKIIGKYVVDDIGTESYMNYGIRKAGPYSDVSFGPVLLDFPEVYPLDGDKLYCNKNINGFPCGGALDYDMGYNSIICTKCGRVYEARELMKAIQSNEVIKKGRQESMKLEIMRGDDIVSTFDSSKEPTDIIRKPRRKDVSPATQMDMISQAIGRGYKIPPTKALDRVCETSAEVPENIFCGGYVYEDAKDESHESDSGYESGSEVADEKNNTSEFEEVKNVFEGYNTDTGFIPREDESDKTEGDSESGDKSEYHVEETTIEDTDVEYSSDDTMEDIPVDDESKSTSEYARDAAQESDDTDDESSDELSEEFNPEDELGEDTSSENYESEETGEDELGGEEFVVDPNEIAKQMMSSGSKNPFV